MRIVRQRKLDTELSTGSEANQLIPCPQTFFGMPAKGERPIAQVASDLLMKISF
jgi:hypothetical protein